MDEGALHAQPLLFCHFSVGIGEPKYMPVPSFDEISKILSEALEGYNEMNAQMNLVRVGKELVLFCFGIFDFHLPPFGFLL